MGTLADRVKISGKKLRWWREQRMKEARMRGEVSQISPTKEPYSQEDLARRVGLSVITIYMIENERRGTRPKNIEKLAEALNVPVDALLVGEGGEDG